MPCTSLWVSAGMLMRLMSPSTRIMGGTPADRCRSEALFLTANANSCAISTAIRGAFEVSRQWTRSIAEGLYHQYVNRSAEFAAGYCTSSKFVGVAAGNHHDSALCAPE